MKIYSNVHKGQKQKIKILGITVYKKEINGEKVKIKYLFGIIKINKNRSIKKYYVLGIKIYKKTDKLKELEFSINQILNKKLITRETIIEETRHAQIVAFEHQKTFPKFKDIHSNDVIVIIGAGPTLSYYEPIKNAKHIALNRTFLYDKVKFDYIFSSDYKGIKDCEEGLIQYDCIKFFGRYINNLPFPDMQIPEYLFNIPKSYKFYSDNRINWGMSSKIYQNISTAPLSDFCSIAFSALHFAFWTHPKKIYLVGCDCKPCGYFDNTKQRETVEFLNKTFNVAKRGYEKFKFFRDMYYPDIEIISINPVGLKGMFQDVYTQSYLNANPEIKAKLGDNVKIIED